MIEPLVEVGAAIVATTIVLFVPGATLLGAMRAGRFVSPLLLPAAAVCATVLLAAPWLVATLALHWSITGFGLGLATVTVLLLVVALLRWSPDRSRSLRERARSVAAFLPPGIALFALAVIDAPQVRSDTYWHVALARKLAELDGLSSARIAFEAGAPGNANYPLPAFHALTALADRLPMVDVWFASWFMTPVLSVAAMLAFGAMAAALVGDRRAALVGSWSFLAIVVLGYGPWFFASRYLSYPGQVAIFLVLPVVVAATVGAIRTSGQQRVVQLATAATATVVIGLLHGNYVLYPALFAGGGAALLLLGRRERVGAALVATAAIVASGALTLGVQLPWIMGDDNFLRGDAAPAGEPTAFLRHRDVFVGSEASFHVELGSLASQPWLVLGALALPVLLYLARRRPGPWVLAGGAVAIAVFARTPWALELLDRLGSVTPATRFDRVWPAAIGVVAIAIGIGWLLDRALDRDRRIGIGATAGTVAAIAIGTWWIDSIRDTRRIVVTPFVEARWVGGLDPSGVPRVAVIAAVVAIVGVAGWVRLRHRLRELDVSDRSNRRRRRHRLAAAAAAAIAVGLAPATVDRLAATWQPQAFDRSARTDGDFVRVEVYPAPVRRVVDSFTPGSTVLASFGETRKVASLVPVQSVEESALRELDRDAPATALEFMTWAGWNQSPGLGRITTEFDYVVVPRGDAAYDGVVAFAQRACWRDRSRGGLWIFERNRDGCPSAQVDQS